MYINFYPFRGITSHKPIIFSSKLRALFILIAATMPVWQHTMSMVILAFSYLMQECFRYCNFPIQVYCVLPPPLITASHHVIFTCWVFHLCSLHRSEFFQVVHKGQVFPIFPYQHFISFLCALTLILRHSRTGTVWFYTSTSNKRAARTKLYTKSLTRDLKRMYSRLTLVTISINL